MDQRAGVRRLNAAAAGIGMTSDRTRRRLIQRLRQKGIRSAAVLDAIATVPRHLFMDEALATRAYEDTALPIGLNQTISQPYVVALMTQTLLENPPMNKVLEVGTGSGYQAAVLAQVVGEVFSVERIEKLYRSARRAFRGGANTGHSGEAHRRVWRLAAAGPLRRNFGDGRAGAASHSAHRPTARRWRHGGADRRGRESGRQRLLKIVRTSEGYDEQALDQVSFVPMLEGTS